MEDKVCLQITPDEFRISPEEYPVITSEQLDARKAEQVLP